MSGVSRGIGRAIAKELLENNFVVYGIGRAHSINHPSFHFLELDLADPKAVEAFKFPEVNSEKAILINNAGILGNVAPAGRLSGENISQLMQINTIAPLQLSNQFIRQFLKTSPFCHIIQISSGAGRRAIPSWSVYCASKAALDLFSETIKIDLAQTSNFYIHSLAPGVVDTDMQKRIRSLSPEEFPLVEQFIARKEKGELNSPDAVAAKIFQLIRYPKNYPNCLINLSDL